MVCAAWTPRLGCDFKVLKKPRRYRAGLSDGPPMWIPTYLATDLHPALKLAMYRLTTSLSELSCQKPRLSFCKNPRVLLAEKRKPTWRNWAQNWSCAASTSKNSAKLNWTN